MNLDNRIKSKLDILTCFDVEEAKSFIGQKGYFANIINGYQNLADRCYGTLTEIKDSSDYPFKTGNNVYWCLFIPESRLKPVEPIDEVTIYVLKYKIEKLEKNLIDLKRKLNYQNPIYNNPFAPWTNCCASINYSDGFNPQANWCSNK